MSMTRRFVAVLAAAPLSVVLLACSADESRPGPAALFEAPVAASPPTTILVRTNHCFVEPVRFDGELWNVPFSEQFGWGGQMPEEWKGAGTIERVDEAESKYVDDGGAVLTFKPIDDASVVAVETAYCK